MVTMVTLSRRRCASSLFGLLLLAGCQTAEPVTVNPSFTTSPALALKRPAEVAVLPVEDGTGGVEVDRHLVFLRQELMRQLVDRFYTPLAGAVVDAALKGNAEAAAAKAAGGSALAPAYLQKVAGHASEEAVFVLRVDRWDERHLLTNRRVTFQFTAALVGADGQQLWYGTMSGEVKAGGLGAAPRDRDYMARSCGELAIRELLLRLPQRLP